MIKPGPSVRPNLEHPQCKGLVGWWLFNERAGNTLYDLSGYGNHALMYNNPAWISGEYGSAVDFVAASNHRAVVPVSPSLTTMEYITVLVRARPKGAFGSSIAIGAINGERTTSYNYFQCDVLGPEWSAEIPKVRSNIRIATTATARAADVPGFSQGDWTTSGYSYDGVYERLFGNGVLIGEYAKTGTLWSNTTYGLVINSIYSGSSGGGEYCDIRIYNRALSPIEVFNIYQEPFAPFIKTRRIYYSTTSGVATATLSLDALVQSSGITKTLAFDALLQQAQTKTASLDTILQIAQTTSTDLDALLRATGTSSITLDSLLQITATGLVSLDALLSILVTEQIGIDALLQVTGQSNITLDALVQSINTSQLSLDSLLQTSNTSQLSLDAILQGGATTVATYLDALVQAAQGKTTSLDALLQMSSTTAVSIDAILGFIATSTISLDSLLQATDTKLLSIDALLQLTYTSSISIDALLQLYRSGSVSLDSVLVALTSSDVLLDALLQIATSESLSLDAVIGGLAIAVQSTRVINISATNRYLDVAPQQRYIDIAK